MQKIECPEGAREGKKNKCVVRGNRGMPRGTERGEKLFRISGKSAEESTREGRRWGEGEVLTGWTEKD